MSHEKPRRGATDTWLTPKYIIDALGPFDLDPCVPENMPWPTAAKMLTPKDDGLLSWPWTGRVWCNPPYGKQCAEWLRRMAMHKNGTALVAARVETQMFFESVWPVADSMFFPKGRISFAGLDGNPVRGAAFPSVFVSYSVADTEKIAASGLTGKLVRLYPSG